MPRTRQPPRLYFRRDERAWVIRDGEKQVRTGCSLEDRRTAEEALARYISDKFTPVDSQRDPARITVAEVLTAYGREHAPGTSDPERIGYAIAALAPWWDGKRLVDVKASTCRAYVEHRRTSRRANMANAKTAARRERTVSDGTIRRELGVLSAAIGHWHAEHGPLLSVPVVSFPPKPEPKPDHLTRNEAARALAGALGWYKVSWSDLATRKVTVAWRRDHDAINRHTARFIILGYRTGTRPGAILKTKWLPNTEGGWIDLERGVMHRRGDGTADSNKRQTPVKLGTSVLAHLRRWKRFDEAARQTLTDKLGRPVVTHLNVVSWGGGSIADIGRSFATAIDYAGLPTRYTPHILRHTRVTWLVEAGLEITEVAAAAGMSAEMVEKVYWHRSPHFQARAAEV